MSTPSVRPRPGYPCVDLETFSPSLCHPTPGIPVYAIFDAKPFSSTCHRQLFIILLHLTGARRIPALDFDAAGGGVPILKLPCVAPSSGDVSHCHIIPESAHVPQTYILRRLAEDVDEGRSDHSILSQYGA